MNYSIVIHALKEWIMYDMSGLWSTHELLTTGDADDEDEGDTDDENTENSEPEFQTPGSICFKDGALFGKYNKLSEQG